MIPIADGFGPTVSPEQTQQRALMHTVINGYIQRLNGVYYAALYPPLPTKRRERIERLIRAGLRTPSAVPIGDDVTMAATITRFRRHRGFVDKLYPRSARTGEQLLMHSLN